MAWPPDSGDDDSMVTADSAAAAAAAASPSGHAHACLTVLLGGSSGHRYRIPEAGGVIGRAQNAEVRIRDEGVSRRHARLWREGEAVYIDDLGSRNGTFVNGEELAAPRVLEEGDKLQVGASVVLRFAHHDELDDRFHESLVASALRDPLTRLFNKRYLLDRLDSELKFARRHEASLSLLMIDVDHFKRLNDEHGHLAGDAVLAHLAQVLQKAVRNEDLVARFGGEELAIVLRAIGLEQAAALGERLRRLVELTVTRYRGRDLRATVSMGVAGYPSTNAETIEQLMEAADQALYRAKRDGRNRVAR